MGMLTPLGEGLFVVDGPATRDMGMPFTTRMSVVRLRDGSVWVSSPVPVPYETLTEVTSLGPVRYLVSPTPRHLWRLARWHLLFPDAELWSSPITPFTLKRGDLPLAGVLGPAVPGSWTPELDHVVLGGPVLQESAFLHAPSRTLLLEDVIQVHHPLPGHPISNAVFRLGGVMAPDGGVSRDIRLTFRPRTTARESVLRMLDWPFDAVVLAHGPIITEHAKDFVARAFHWLID
ncbi:hypothetical protein GCM10009819_08270 [Agromyces tropicus]|uniref:DUF4336 domain-containing protein n=1 Tax=Agromyces tropicus TaxID=555371 RepID=A0ABN2U3W7_9MICO